MSNSNDSIRWFPLQRELSTSAVKAGPLLIPWVVAEKAYAEYVKQHGTRQSMERLAQRGGFGWGEMDRLHPDWREECDTVKVLCRTLRGIQTMAEEELRESPQCGTLLWQIEADARAALDRLAGR